MQLREFIREALTEDTTDPDGHFPAGDHSSRSTLPADARGSARLLVKEDGVLAGMEIARAVFAEVDPELEVNYLLSDGDRIKVGDIALTVEGNSRSILLSERLVLNFMQRMSGVASLTRQYVDAVEGTGVRILDTRKTTPNFRFFQKSAVRIGGGTNHRMGLYDMIMIKDNHIDFKGGIAPAIESARRYVDELGHPIGIEIETRSLEDVQKVLECGGVQRIMLDNFSVEAADEAVEFIDGRVETEISGGIDLTTVRAYAECRPDFISVGALTHSSGSLDLSLKVKL